MLRVVVIFFLLCGTALAQAPEKYALPNPALTPGVVNSKVTQSNIKSNICVKGWTKTVRPPAAYTTGLKVKQLSAYRFPDGYGFVDPLTAAYEEDHLISLELGGNPTDPKNLWPQTYGGTWNAHVKDKLENALNAKVCSGAITLHAAQQCISSNWIECYKKQIGSQP